MSAGDRAGKHRRSQNKLNGERGTPLETAPSKDMFSGKSFLTTLLAVSLPMSRAGNKELQEWKIYWNGDTKDIHF